MSLHREIQVVYTEFSVMHIFTSFSRWSENASQHKESTAVNGPSSLLADSGTVMSPFGLNFLFKTENIILFEVLKLCWTKMNSQSVTERGLPLILSEKTAETL